MNKLLSVRLIAVFLLGSFVSVASAQDIKIASVNAIRILESSPQAEIAHGKIEKEFAPRERQLVEEQKRLKSLEDRMLKDGAIMSESERANLEREILSMRRDLRRKQEEYREDLNFRRNEEFTQIQKSILEAIQNVAKEMGYDLVIGEGVIYASDKVDISDRVIEHLKR
ncbi:MAG: OmpH family outer membrane protein [Gammaproteobacteria bacterium]